MSVQFNYSTDEFSPASIGLSRILKVALDLGIDVYHPVKWSDIQEKYLEKYHTPLNQAELKKYFKTKYAKQVVSRWCQEVFVLPVQDTEDPPILMIQLRYSKSEAIKFLAQDLHVWHGVGR